MTSDFYDTPALDRSRAGDLVRTRPVFVPQLTSAAGAWQVIYISTNSRSERIPASGIVLIPDAVAEPGATAILVYCSEFRGLGGVCAPSQLLAIGTEPDTAGIEAALRRGWVVAIPDGEGLGLTGGGPHTFLAARAGGRVVLDLARAVYRGANLDVPVAPVVAWGYADGGRAVAAAGELQPWYAPEVDLRGIAAGAVASDLAALAPAFSRGVSAGLGLAGLIGLSRAYDQLPLRHVLTENGVRAVAEAQHLTGIELLQRFPQPVAHWCRRPEPWNDHWWRRVLALETLAHTMPAMPLHLYHGSGDEIVPVSAGRRTLIAYRQRGTEISWREYDADHRATADAATSDVLARLGENITRRPPPKPSRPIGEGEHTEHATRP
ncbi:lipase family protein [Nocardia pneumoniae]|uniref:lipase family protein n=1 Tax=Nocardia pneumoniae TaxID=228601 RepID=UPI0003174EFA|nr:lipase family protein [Nocardia pneumoniae]